MKIKKNFLGVKRNLNSFFLSFLLFLSFSRGLFEMITPKTYAYSLTLLSFFAFTLFAIKHFRFYLDKFFLYSFLFLIISILSLFYSYLNNQSFTLFFLFIFLFVFLLNIYKSAKFISIDQIFILNILIFFFIAASYFEIFGIKLTGTMFNSYSFSWHSVRPASFTGTYLHYPVIISFLYIYLVINSKKHSLWHSFILLSIFLTYSRTAFFIIFLFYLLYFLKLFFTKTIFTLCFLAILFVFFFFFSNFLREIIYETLLFDSAGNAGRLDAWKRSISNIGVMNIFFGTHFGSLSLMYANILNVKASVTESSLFSLLLNFGLVGSIIFYKLLYDFLKELNFGKILFLVIFFTSMTAQYIESLHFLFLLLVSKIVIEKKL